MQVSVQIATLRKLEIEQPTTEAIEIIDAEEMAARLKLPKSWILEGTRSRAIDPIPHLKFGRYVRFQWRSRELTQPLAVWDLVGDVGRSNEIAVHNRALLIRSARLFVC